MKKIWIFIKKVLKRILPPTVHVFMREVNGLHGAMAAREANLSHQLGEARNALEKRLDRLGDLFESANRENLRLFFDAREERREMDERYAQLAGQYKELIREVAGLREQQAELGKTLAGNQRAIEKRLSENQRAIEKRLSENRTDIEKRLEGNQLAADKKLAEMAKSMTEYYVSVADGQKKLEGSLADVEKSIPNKPVLWSNSFERNVVSENWGDVSDAPDFKEKYLRLISGMDEKSVQIITRILLRQKKYLGNNSERMDLYTREEQEEIRRLQEEFYDEILRLSDDLYAYRHYLLPADVFEPSVFFYMHGIHELKTAERVKGNTIIDVGGFIGDSVLVLSQMRPGRIFTFEAEPSNFALLKKTMELNHMENVTAENVALSAENGTLTLHVGGSCSTTIERPGMTYSGDISVPTIRLDDYVEEHGIRDVALIKVDVEGGEPGFLDGAKKTICEQKPILLLSIYHNAHDFFEIKPLLESWDLGYRFHIHKPTYGNATSETLLVAEIV